MKNFVFILIITALIHFYQVHSFSSEYDIRDLLRRKRTLLFPNPLDSETKLQVLFGLGLPMEDEVSMTLGYVLKCNYDLPYNASNTIDDDPYVRYGRVLDYDKTSESFPESSMETGTNSRWSLYRMLEIIMETDVSVGKACLLRAICETSEAPFRNGQHGLLGEILHTVLTPSTTSEKYQLYSDREYHKAELIGKDSDGEACRLIYRECLHSPLDYFTKRDDFFLP